MVRNKVFEVDKISVSVYGNAIDGVVSIDPPQAANREKTAIETVTGCAGYNSRIITGESSFEITAISDSYDYLNQIVDSMELGTIVYTIPGTIYTMLNAVIAKVEPSSVSDSAPTVTVSVLYQRVTTKKGSY